MINHFRTLMINRMWMPRPGYTQIDTTYRPIPEPDAVRHAKAAIFGPRADQTMLDYRTQQLVRIVESSRLADHLRLYDSRMAEYSEWAWPDTVFQPLVRSRLDGTADPFFPGEPSSPDASGICLRDYDVEFSPPDSLHIQDRTDLTEWSGNVAIAGQLTESVPLPGSGYGIVCPADGPGRWLIQIVNRPTTGPADWLDRLAGLSYERTLELFGDTTKEPNRSWWRLWQDGVSPVERVAACALAIVGALEVRRV